MNDMSKQADSYLEQISKGIKTTQEICERNTTLLGIDKEQIERLNENVTKNIDLLQDLNHKSKKFDEAIDSLEKAAARPSNNMDEVVCMEKAEYLQYLRTGDAPSKEVQQSVAHELATKRIVGGSPEQIASLTKTLVEGNNPAGGYWVRPEFADFTIDRLFETSRMRQIASVMTLSSQSLEIIIDDEEFGAGFEGEVDFPPETTTPQFGQLTIFAHKLSAKPTASAEMLEDAGFDVEAWLQTRVSERFARIENTKFVVGSGNKSPKGFLTLPAWAAEGVYERGKIEQLNSGTNGAFDADNFIDLQNLLLEGYQPNAVWTMQRRTFGEVMKLKQTNGTFLINPAIIAQGASRILLGQPVMFFNDMPKIAADSLSVAYGDFRRGYTILDRTGIRVLRDPFSQKPFIQFYTTKRVGGDVTNFQSIKILKLSA